MEPPPSVPHPSLPLTPLKSPSLAADALHDASLYGTVTQGTLAALRNLAAILEHDPVALIIQQRVPGHAAQPQHRRQRSLGPQPGSEQRLEAPGRQGPREQPQQQREAGQARHDQASPQGQTQSLPQQPTRLR
jgi:hypothetical protein